MTRTQYLPIFLVRKYPKSQYFGWKILRESMFRGLNFTLHTHTTVHKYSMYPAGKKPKGGSKHFDQIPGGTGGRLWPKLIAVLSRQKAMALKSCAIFALQSTSRLLNLALSSIKWSLSYLKDPKQDLKIKETLYIRILTFLSSIIYGNNCV